MLEARALPSAERLDTAVSTKLKALSPTEGRGGSRSEGTLLAQRFGLFEDQCFHISQDEPRVESTGAVDVSDAGLAVDEEHSKGVEERALGIIGIRAFVDGLVVGGEDGGESGGRLGGGEAPFAARFFFADGFGIIRETLGCVVVGVEAQADEAEVFRQQSIIKAELMELVQDAGRVRAGFAGGAAGVDEAQDGDPAVGQVAQGG